MKKGKKWLIVISVLVTIAIAVTLIVVLVPKDYNKIVKLTQQHTQTIYLKSDKDDEAYQEFQSKINQVYSQTYGIESEKVYQICTDINKILDFYNEYIVFANNNKAFQNNYNKIVGGFKDVAKWEDEMREIVNDTNVLGNKDNTFISSQWKNFKENFCKYLNAYAEVITSLSDIYKNCIEEGVLQNKMTYLVLDTLPYYVQSIADDFATKQLLSLSWGKFSDFTKFVKYLDEPSGRTTLFNYNFNAALQGKVDLVYLFQNVYGSDKTLRDVIDSIGANGDVKYQQSTHDYQGVLTQVSSFLTGGMTV